MVAADETLVVVQVVAARAVVKTEVAAATTDVQAAVMQAIATIVAATAPVHRTDLREAAIQQVRVSLDHVAPAVPGDGQDRPAMAETRGVRLPASPIHRCQMITPR